MPINDPLDVIAYGNSFFVEHGLFLPLLSIIGIILLTWYVIFFLLIEENLFGNKYVKGLIYGLSFFLIYMTAFFEFYSFFNGPLIQAVLSGFADGTPLLLTGLLSGIFLGTNKTIKTSRPAKYLICIIFIPVLFTIGRIIFYNYIYVSSKIYQLNSMLLILIYGISISISYFFLTQGMKLKRYYLIPLFYGLIFFPVSLSGNMIICLQYNFPSYQMVMLSVIDLLTIIFGGLITEFLNKKQDISSGNN